MLPASGLLARTAALALLSLAAAGAAQAQSLLTRSPNISGAWTAPSGVVQFNFLHRFVRSDPPERKITSFPTFIVGIGLPANSTAGFVYSTNSTLVPRYPNEWEFFGRVRPVSAVRGAPVDAGVQLGYNLASRGVDGEVSVGRQVGRVGVTAVARLLSRPDTTGSQAAFGGGAIVRLSRYIAIAGDAVGLTSRDAARGERRVAWSAGVHLAIPSSPHTLSLQATNTNTATLQGASRGTRQTRYGFEFTIPITLARYFGHRQPARAPTDTSTSPAVGAVTRAGMRDLAFTPAQVYVLAGGTVEWTNHDQVQHSVVATDGTFDSGLIDPGATWRHTFTTPGRYAYSCTPHPFMRGVVVVRGRE